MISPAEPLNLDNEARACWYRVAIARARLLLQVSGPDRDVSLADLLSFARLLGDESSADSMATFRAAQEDVLHTAQSELDRAPGPDG